MAGFPLLLIPFFDLVYAVDGIVVTVWAMTLLRFGGLYDAVFFPIVLVLLFFATFGLIIVWDALVIVEPPDAVAARSCCVFPVGSILCNCNAD